MGKTTPKKPDLHKITEEEQKAIKQIADQDEDLARFTEDILVSMPRQGKTPGKYNFDDEVWNRVNTRRTSRGEAEI
jgi:hypothetical protein